MSRPGLEPRPPAWEASTLEKSHLDSLFHWLFRTSTPGRRTSSTSLNIIEKVSLKTSKAMELSKIYLLKKSKSDEIISFTSSTGLPQCRCIAHELLSVEGKYSLLLISSSLTLLPE
jgi:hypothetical protein